MADRVGQRCFLLICGLTFGVAILIGGEYRPAEAQVEALILTNENWDEVVPAGKEVDAILGDLVIRNSRVTAVIAQPLASRHANMTVRDVGGCLIDFTIRHQGSDQLSAFYPGGKAYRFRSWSLHAADGTPLEWTNHSAQATEALEILVISPASENRAELRVRYRLSADQEFLQITQEYCNAGDQPLPMINSLLDELRIDGGKEDLLKMPNGVGQTFWAEDRFWNQAYLLHSPIFEVSSRSDARNTVLKYADSPAETNPQETVTVQPGETVEHAVQLGVAANLCQLQTLLARKEQRPVGTTACTFYTKSPFERPLPGARVELSKDNAYFGTLWTDGSGRIDQSLPEGIYQFRLSYLGQTIIEKSAIEIASDRLNEFTFDVGFPVGVAKIQVVDDEQQPVPCKVELNFLESDTPLNFGPESATIGVQNLRYLVSGRDELLLPAGKYAAVISHGPEYDAAFLEFTVTAGEDLPIQVTLPRVVDSRGWVSGEFHSHSSPSGDNTGSQLGRVMNLVCEHLEFAPCTEHNRIDTYEPHIRSLGIASQLATCTGLELTGGPLPLNHQNAFPLIHVPRTQDGGAPLTDPNPEAQIQRLALWDQRSEKLVQQNHPDIGWLFNDKSGDGMADGGFAESIPFIDAMEIHPITAILAYDSTQAPSSPVLKNRMFNWLQLLNQGHRITGVVNTDAHYNFHGSGGYRNWIRSSSDEPQSISTAEMVAQTKKGAVVMSNGPFLTVQLQDAAAPETIYGPGDDVELQGDLVHVQIRVQCANWLDIDRVYLLINGVTPAEYNFRRSSHPDLFSPKPVRFEQTIAVKIPRDAHLIVVAAGENSQLGPVAGPVNGKNSPVAVSNPIYLDRDGGGFMPNGDLLDGALPVKGE